MNNINLTVKSLNNDTYKITIANNKTVAELMSQVQVVSNGKYAANNLRLIYAGQDISVDTAKNRKLADLGIEKQSTIFIVMRL